MNMFKKLTRHLYLFFLIQSSLVFSFTLKEKIEQAASSPGSFIVTEHQKTISFLRLHSFTPPFVFLEEINIPSEFIKKEAMDWDKWIKEKAPNHTSWLLYQIDLTECKILNCYSFSRESFISLTGQESFLATLMSLPLELTPLENRKKIGPKPPSDMPDIRKTWSPPKILNGKKYKNNHFEMMHTKWPKDDSELSGRDIDLYFDTDQPLFPFPYWIEIGDGYNVFKIHVIDSGYSTLFPFKQIPPKAPSILTLALIKEDLHITLKDALTFNTFQVIATERHSDTYTSSLLPCELTVEGSIVNLTISRKTLSQHLDLEKNYPYIFTIIPLENPSLTIESSHSLRLNLK